MADHIDLSDRTKLRLSGGDRVRYLNGQVSNQVEKATVESAIYACVTTAKGKMEADIFISVMPEGDAFLIDGPAELREQLLARLDRYIIADDCELTDATDDFELVHLLGNPPAIEGAWSRAVNRFGIEAADVLAPAGTGLIEKLSTRAVTPERLEELRIANGVAQWGAELSNVVLPQEARLQDRAIDFQKGCYVGQETISRIKSVGQVNRELVTLAAVDEGKTPAIEPGELLYADGVEKSVGQLTSTIFSAILGRWIALGYVRRQHLAEGTRLGTRDTENNSVSFLEIRDFSGI
ncbi:MAG: folate-binding protein YgfZ [Verrucomicrobiales bacterium]|jgi:folate-binding protein YgfZ